jgi:hypothetical protein
MAGKAGNTHSIDTGKHLNLPSALSHNTVDGCSRSVFPGKLRKQSCASNYILKPQTLNPKKQWTNTRKVPKALKFCKSEKCCGRYGVFARIDSIVKIHRKIEEATLIIKSN